MTTFVQTWFQTSSQNPCLLLMIAASSEAALNEGCPRCLD